MPTSEEKELPDAALAPFDDIPVIVLDAEGHLVGWTAGAERLTGYSASDVLTRHASKLYAADDVERGLPDAHLSRAAEGGESVRDRWLRRADGSRFWARTVLRSRHDEEGRLSGFIELIVDLSDHLLLTEEPGSEGLLEHTLEGIISTNQDHRIVRFNLGAARMFGYRRDEVLGEPLSMLLPERLRDFHERRMDAFKTGQLDSARMAEGRVVTGLTKDGREFPVEATISRFVHEGGTELGVILRDASDRVAMEHDLREREARARELADAMPFPIQFLDRDLSYVFANTAAAEWIGRTAEEIPGLSLVDVARDIGSTSTLDAAMPQLTAALRGQQGTFSGRARRADGSVREVDVRFVPTRDASGSPDGVYAILFDRTEERRDESARRFRTATGRLLDAPHEPVLALENTVLLATAGFADECTAFRGRDGGGVLRVASGKGGGVVQAEVSLADIPPTVVDAIRDGWVRTYMHVVARSTHVVVTVPCSEGGVGALLFKWEAPFEVGVGEVEIARDLGVRLADALDRLELFKRATEATQARDWLLHKVTHDLGNPVASISMATDRMLRAAPTPERRKRSRMLLDGVARQAREMELIIEELLDASALRTGRVTVAARAVEPGPLVHDAIALAEMVAAARGVELRAHAPSGSLRVLADPYHIRRALSALISDALGWSRRGGRIGVDVVDSGDEVVFGVTGPGPDVPAEELSRLLDRGQEPGAGGRSGARVSLPLLIASSIVRAHGSRLDAMSTLSGETRYVFALPAAS